MVGNTQINLIMKEVTNLEQAAFEGILQGVKESLNRELTEIEEVLMFSAFQTGLTVSKIINKSEPSLKLILN
jgi:hypothetical protein